MEEEEVICTFTCSVCNEQTGTQSKPYFTQADANDHWLDTCSQGHRSIRLHLSNGSILTPIPPFQHHPAEETGDGTRVDFTPGGYPAGEIAYVIVEGNSVGFDPVTIDGRLCARLYDAPAEGVVPEIGYQPL